MPQDSPDSQGGNPADQAMQSIMQQADALKQIAAALADAGAPEQVVAKIAQAGDLLASALEEVKGGGQGKMGVEPDMAGAPSARPADMRG